MNKDEVTQQIQKFKARRIKNRLANYGTTVSIFLGLSIFARGFTLSSLYSFLIFLPVITYFLLQTLKFAKKARKIKLRLQELQSLTYDLRPTFSVINFLKQPSFAFRLTLMLFFLVLFTTFARLRTPDPTLTQSTTYHVLSTNN